MTETASDGLAVFGGTFNPVHLGHLRSAVEVLEYLPCSELRFMPCSLPPHRQAPGVSARERLSMIELAIAGEPRLSCDGRELERAGPSYTIDSLHSLRRDIGSQRSLTLVMGCDALLGLNRWHRWQELLDHCHIAAIARPGWDFPESGEVGDYLSPRLGEPDSLAATASGSVVIATLRQLPISATEIRSLLQSERSVRYLVPEPVHAYIHDHQLYRQRDDDCHDQ